MDEQGLFSEVLAALLATQPDEKIQSVEWLGREWTNGRLDRPKKPPTTLLTKSPTTKSAPIKIEHPGRPEKPLLVHHRDLDKRKLSTPAGRAALIHAIAHIEFNAINLALDAVYRFREMPEAYYSDWLSVAMDESVRMLALVPLFLWRLVPFLGYQVIYTFFKLHFIFKIIEGV